jgi:DNA-binding MarR family transcriptional regulator
MTDNKKPVCNICSNHCTVDKLQCKKGIKYFNHFQMIHTTDDLSEAIERIGNDMTDNYENNMDVNSQNETIERDQHEGGHEKHHRDENHSHKCERHGRHSGFGRFSFEDNNEDDLLSLLAKCSHILHHKKGGKRGQGKILKILAKRQEINQKELQEILGIESGSMSELVIKLEQKGLITRTKDETDKRMTKLMITELGLELSKELETRDEEENKLLYGSLNEQEQEELKTLLKKLLQGWEENYELLREKQNSHFDKGEHHHSNRDGKHHKGGRKHGRNQ